jgi:hypothetical protein
MRVNVEALLCGAYAECCPSERDGWCTGKYVLTICTARTNQGSLARDGRAINFFTLRFKASLPQNRRAAEKCCGGSDDQLPATCDGVRHDDEDAVWLT